ncbi:hypothetical protein BBO99_00002126 [Phytophthora kernoviae]|uniref:Uncharacterized protein n=2 Tax=Phytophthora kernoviae TaxID=325452 RepID=A0A421GXL5_9STRA|nr:hypothetical protein G195_003933 [Phytophthora kernoviae 00238/432]KAG2523737.1 hypothetical protein JM16_004982 [Phytophthora kernoviae]KAG2525510.1 hypothetical protein JM18_004869 [Phytophthora kernoviae]RLN14751.1 hypothetical protein BBI17_002026 [Phytophthora kernoviae]RLN83450.1 hypothetical protein BBO99_00002126 [Phytophthora kernoviae]
MYGFPRIHGLMYGLKNDQLNEMDINFRSMIRTLTEGHNEEPNRVSTKFIKHAMAKESILFSETEINSDIAQAQEGETDKSTVNIEKLAQHFDH